MRTSTIVINQKGFKPGKLIITPDTMKYKIMAGSALFDQLTLLFKQVEECRKATHDLVSEFGVTEWVGSSRGSLAGGVSGFKMDKAPEHWKRVYQNQFHNAYFPRSIPRNKLLLKRISALPTIEREVINEIIGFRPQCIGLTFHRGVGIKFGFDFHVIQVAEACEFTPLDGMEEITVSEFNQLCVAINNAEKEAIQVDFDSRYK